MVRKILLVSLLLVGGVAFAEQGVRPEPTGCAYGDSIPVDSDKCVAPVDNTPQTVTGPQNGLETPRTLPAVGADGL